MLKKFKNKLVRVISLTLALMLFSTTTYAKDELQVNKEKVSTESEAVLVYDMTTGEILFDKNSHDKMYPASVTKLLTGLLAIEYGDMTDTITFNSDSVNLEANSSNLAFVSGEKINLKNLLYGLMLKSANEAANQLAYYIEEKSGLSYKDAANKKLSEIGAFDSNFTSPSGLHKDTHYTTAYDLMLIARAAYKNEAFREIFSTISYTIPKTNKSGEREVYNTHKMLYKTSPYHIDGVTGGKTGFTDEAGHCLVTFFENENGMKLLAVTMNASTYFNDTVHLLNYFNDNYETKTYFKKGDHFTTIPVCDESGVKIDQLDLTLSEDLTLTLPSGWDEDLIKKLVVNYLKEQKEKEATTHATNEETEDEDESDNDEEDTEDDEESEDEIDIDDLEINDELLQEYNLTEKANMLVLDYENDLFTINVDLPENIMDTVLENDVVGTIKITYNNNNIKTISIISQGEYDITDSIDLTILYYILFAAFLAILIVYITKMVKLTKEEKEIKSKK
ncbi:MAG: hypothetical protein MJ245_04495 [Clostridia bacterium]|nr:hypothetical protein [Clostridia bacterium]